MHSNPTVYKIAPKLHLIFVVNLKTYNQIILCIHIQLLFFCWWIHKIVHKLQLVINHLQIAIRIFINRTILFCAFIFFNIWNIEPNYFDSNPTAIPLARKNAGFAMDANRRGIWIYGGSSDHPPYTGKSLPPPPPISLPLSFSTSWDPEACLFSPCCYVLLKHLCRYSVFGFVVYTNRYEAYYIKIYQTLL